MSFYCVNTSYLTDSSICPGTSRSRQMPEKGVLSRTPSRDRYCLPFTRWLMPPSLARCPPCDVIFLFGANSSSANEFHSVKNIVFSKNILPIGIFISLQKCEFKFIDHDGVYFRPKKRSLWPCNGIF